MFVSRGVGCTGIYDFSLSRARAGTKSGSLIGFVGGGFGRPWLPFVRMLGLIFSLEL